MCFLKSLLALGRETQEGTLDHLFIQACFKENLLQHFDPLKSKANEKSFLVHSCLREQKHRAFVKLPGVVN